jgi:hypothetical protein
MLEEKAIGALANAKTSAPGEMHEVFIDPATISVVISVISAVIKLYQGCRKTPEEATVAMKDPNWQQRWKLKRLTRSTLRRKGIHDVTADHVMEGVIQEGKTTTVDEVRQMYTEV